MNTPKHHFFHCFLINICLKYTQIVFIIDMNLNVLIDNTNDDANVDMDEY